jgi:signal transduction histidine kinase
VSFDRQATDAGFETEPRDDGAIEGLREALLRAHREIAELRADVASLSADRTEWLTVLAHELRTPLTVISGYNRLMLSGEAGPLTDAQARYLGECTKSCKHLDRFIESLLDTVHDGFLEKGLEVAPNDLVGSIRNVCGLVQPLVAERGLELSIEVDPAARYARFDTTRIEQVVTNLLGNAIRFTKPSGTLRIVAHKTAVRGNELVEVAVIDQGPGVAPSDRERIFEPFVQASGKTSGNGLGLGLAICRRIVAAHGGSISVTDEPGGGSRFVFTLPAANAAGSAS